jgi:hypothetical protein
LFLVVSPEVMSTVAVTAVHLLCGPTAILAAHFDSSAQQQLLHSSSWKQGREAPALSSNSGGTRNQRISAGRSFHGPLYAMLTFGAATEGLVTMDTALSVLGISLVLVLVNSPGKDGRSSWSHTWLLAPTRKSNDVRMME